MNLMEDIQPIAKVWQPFHAESQIGHIRDDDHYDRMVMLADKLIADGAGNETHELYDLWLLVSDLIYQYDQEHYSLPKLTGADMLRFLMGQHDLNQSDFPEVGSQGIISEILCGKRELNVRQIKILSARFNVSPAAFF